jgi:hypothetical protein
VDLILLPLEACGTLRSPVLTYMEFGGVGEIRIDVGTFFLLFGFLVLLVPLTYGQGSTYTL